MEGLSWVISGGFKCHHKCSTRREAEGGFRDRIGEDNVIMEAERGAGQPPAKEGQQLPEAARGKAGILR